ncbi:DUF2335 domain-containing protein [Enterococcus faecalis]
MSVEKLNKNEIEELKKELIADDEVEEILDDLPKIEREKIESLIIRQSYSGPLPSPRLLKEFDEVEKGAAKKIIDNYLAESEHRRGLENKSLEYSARDVKMGAWFGFILGLIGLLGGFSVLLFTNHAIAGSILSGGSLVALVALFLKPQKNKNDAESQSESEIEE